MLRFNQETKELFHIIIGLMIQLYISSAVLMQKISPVFQVITLGFLLLYCLAYFWTYFVERSQFDFYHAMFLFYYLYILFSCVMIKDISLVLHGLYEYIVFTLAFFGIAFMFKRKTISVRVLTVYSYVFLGISVLLVILGFVEFFNGYLILGGPVHQFSSANKIYARAQVFTGAPLIYGTLMTCFSLIHQYYFLKTKKNIFLIASLMTLAGVVISGSRGPLVAVLIGFIIQLSFSFRILSRLKKISTKRRWSLLFLFLFLLTLFIFVANIYEGNNPILKKIFSLLNWSTDIGNVGRLNSWSKYIQIFTQNWLTGTGISTTGSVTLAHPLNIGVTESGLLKVLVELGIIGFLLFYGTIVSILYRGVQYLKNSQSENRQLAVLCVSIIAAILVESSILQITEIFSVSVILWGFLGILYSITRSK